MTAVAAVIGGPLAIVTPPAAALVQLALGGGLLMAAAVPLGRFMAAVYAGRSPRFARPLLFLERTILRACGVEAGDEMTWQRYATATVMLSAVGFAIAYGLQRLQHLLPLNPGGAAAVAPDLAFNTAVSFVTNTNWQGYAGEVAMSQGTQMLALTVQNFVSAAVGMAVFAAFVRGFTRASSQTIGNFWVDVVRGTVHVLLPLATLVAVPLTSQGVVQSFGPAREVNVVEQPDGGSGQRLTQRIVVGPVASQVAIKQLGTNGGGYYNANSAHPFENPTPLSNLLELLAILLIPTAICFTFGELVGDRRQGWALFAAMAAIFLPLAALVVLAEQRPSPQLLALGIDAAAGPGQAGGTMEGKEVRFGIVNSAVWAAATTAASNGSVNAMHDSFTPLGGLVPMLLMQLGEVVFGGVGSGLYGLVLFALVAVFLAGLMVGRTPEYLGKKIGGFEIKMAVIAILLPCVTVLVGTAIALQTSAGRAGIANPGAHGFSEVLYALSSASNNNGSGFAGLAASSPFYNGLLGAAMMIGRFWVMLPVIAIAGSLAAKKHVPAGPGTLPTHTPLFVAMVVAVVLIVGALSFFPALALGPIVEELEFVSAARAAGARP